MAEASDRLAARLAEIEAAGTTAAARAGEAQSSFSGVLDALLERTSNTLDEIRAGINVQSAAVAALVEQASAGIGKAGAEAAESLAANVDHANASLEGLSQRVAEQDRSSQRMIAEIDRGLALIDERFAELAAHGDERANRFLESLDPRAFGTDTLATQASSQEMAIGSIAERTSSLHEAIDRLTDEIRDGLGTAIGEAQGGTERLVEAAALAPTRNQLDPRCGGGGWRASVGNWRQHCRASGPVGRLLSTVDDGVGNAQSRLTELASCSRRSSARPQISAPRLARTRGLARPG